MTILSLEGPSYAGKTTAIRLLRRIPEIAGRAIFFGCYVRHLRPTHPIPPARTSSAAEQLAAFETFMSAEADRVTMAAMHPGRLVVLDRSIDTLMAHAYALDRLYDFGVHHQVRQRLEELPHLRPHHTIYLDVPDAILHAAPSHQPRKVHVRVLPARSHVPRPHPLLLHRQARTTDRWTDHRSVRRAPGGAHRPGGTGTGRQRGQVSPCRTSCSSGAVPRHRS